MDQGSHAHLRVRKGESERNVQRGSEVTRRFLREKDVTAGGGLERQQHEELKNESVAQERKQSQA